MMRSLYVVLLLSALVLCSAMLRNCRGSDGKAGGESGSPAKGDRASSLGRYLETVWIDSVDRSSPGRLIVLVLNPDDLGCIPCILNFLDFCDTLQKVSSSGSHIRGMMLVMRGQGSYADQRRKIAAWAMAGNIRLPFCLVEQALLRLHHIAGTSVALTDTSGEVELAAEFPLPTETRNTILSRLSIR